MQSALEIKRRINAVGQTKKITGAMQLVSSVRVHSVMQHCEYYSKYFNRIQAAMKEIIRSVDGNIDSPYFTKGKTGRKVFIVISSDKGMAGSYNSAVLETALEDIQKESDPTVISVGKVGTLFFESNGIRADRAFDGFTKEPPIGFSRLITELLDEIYMKNGRPEITAYYTSFFGRGKAKPAKRRILPILQEDLITVKCEEEVEGAILHPDAHTLFDELVPQYVMGLVFGFTVQSYASENFMRMTSMQSATKNADELLKKLTVQYNMARQSAITQEITEITGASEILMKED